MPAPPSTVSPRPTLLIESSPLPPSRISMPAPPASIVSFPLPPKRKSFPAPPEIESAPEPPITMKFSMLTKFSELVPFVALNTPPAPTDDENPFVHERKSMTAVSLPARPSSATLPIGAGTQTVSLAVVKVSFMPASLSTIVNELAARYLLAGWSGEDWMISPNCSSVSSLLSSLIEIWTTRLDSPAAKVLATLSSP